MSSGPQRGMADLEVLLPVHNEADSIEATIREIHEELSRRLNVAFIVCEDGSTDNSQEILHELSKEIPMWLNLSEARRGYSQAVRDGMSLLEADHLLCLDSDGQCDPADFPKLWDARMDCDVVIGWRVNRADTLVRRICSRCFYLLYQVAFRTPAHDPSCPFVLIRKDVVERLVGELGAMQQGFWWEFVARVHRKGFRLKEIPVHHRQRAKGVTQVYRWGKLPGIFLRHVAAIVRVWRETR